MTRKSTFWSDMSESARLGFVVVAFAIVLIAAIGAVSWIARTGALAQNAVLAPMEEQVRRNTFEQSKAYRDGVVQELRSMQFQYFQAKPEHQAGLASVIRHTSAGLPADDIPADLQQFIRTLP